MIFVCHCDNFAGCLAFGVVAWSIRTLGLSQFKKYKQGQRVAYVYEIQVRSCPHVHLMSNMHSMILIFRLKLSTLLGFIRWERRSNIQWRKEYWFASFTLIFCLNQNYDLLKLAMMHLSSTMIFIKLMRSCIFEYLINVTFECTDHEFDMCVSWFNIYSVWTFWHQCNKLDYLECSLKLLFEFWYPTKVFDLFSARRSNIWIWMWQLPESVWYTWARFSSYWVQSMISSHFVCSYYSAFYYCTK